MNNPRPPPHSIEAEEYLLSCILLDGNDTLARCEDTGITARSFYDPRNQIVFGKLMNLQKRGIAIDLATLAEELKTSQQLEEAGGIAYLVEISGRTPTTAQASYFIEKVRDLHTRRELIESVALVVEHCAFGNISVVEITNDLADKLAKIEASSAGTNAILAAMVSREFNTTKTIIAPESRFCIAGRTVCTLGNLASLIAQAKSGKSALIGAFIAAAFAADAKSLCADFYGDAEPDTLGVVASPPDGRVLLHLDTEQSAYDHDRLVRTAMRRACVDIAPNWFRSFALAGSDATTLNRSLKALLSKYRRGDIYAIILDGVADFVTDVNDAKECMPFVAWLHDTAIKYDCPIIGVLHENPGQFNTGSGKARGHLGSQLERKAESNICLKKDADGITTIYGEKMRGASIPESIGPRFQWSDEHSMHRSMTTKAVSKEAERQAELRELAGEVFNGSGLLSYKEFCDLAKEARGRSQQTAERWFTIMKKHGIIRNAGAGKWALSI